MENQQPQDMSFQEKCQAYVNAVINALPATDKRLLESMRTQADDATCQISQNSAPTDGQTKRSWGLKRSCTCLLPHPKGIATKIGLQPNLPSLPVCRVVYPFFTTSTRLPVFLNFYPFWEFRFKKKNQFFFVFFCFYP